jgi:eukaryotic-like serine/threonine-protein kinase
VSKTLETYRAHLQTVGIHLDHIRGAPRSTLEPERATAGPGDLDIDSISLATLANLPPMRVEGSGDSILGPADLRLGAILGEGAMGVVRSGVQLSLKRNVAVKQLRPEHRGAAARFGLLQEAWITGQLQHPNIVPVYALGRSDDDLPMFMMKQIEGTRWSEVIADPDAHLELCGSDPLGFHLRVLEQVCNGASAAHASGILHRDLKPDNVMIGSFGEVYVLDWGIAVALDPERHQRLPSVASVKQVAGTPAYMAPEMAAAEAQRIGVRSDVYLLGAILHEVINGHPPHKGGDLMSVLAQAFRSPAPVFEPDIPEELGQICAKAMACDPADRYPDATLLRRALEAFGRHRSSIAVCSHAQERLTALQVQLGEADLGRARATGAEARFGFMEALRAWPENPAALQGLQNTLKTTVEHCVHMDDLVGARAALAELDPSDPTLVASVEALAAKQAGVAGRLAELDQRDDDRDMGSTAQQRRVTAWVMAFLLGGLCLALGAAHRSGFSVGYLEMTGLVAVLGAAAAADAVWVRRSSPNRVARRMSGLLVTSLLAITVHWLGSWALMVPFAAALAQTALIASTVLGLGAVTLHRGYGLPALSFALAYLAIGLQPSWGFEVLGVAAMIAFGSVAMMPREGKSEPLF